MKIREEINTRKIMEKINKTLKMALCIYINKI